MLETVEEDFRLPQFSWWFQMSANGIILYLVGRKLHILDGHSKEHEFEKKFMGSVLIPWPPSHYFYIDYAQIRFLIFICL